MLRLCLDKHLICSMVEYSIGPFLATQIFKIDIIENICKGTKM
jgi:hypothetical protein